MILTVNVLDASGDTIGSYDVEADSAREAVTELAAQFEIGNI